MALSLPTTSSITNPSPTVIIIASVLLLFGMVTLIPDSDEIYDTYLDDDENKINRNINRKKKIIYNNNLKNVNNTNNNISNNNKNNKTSFLNRIKKIFSFLSINNNENIGNNNNNNNDNIMEINNSNNIDESFDSFDDSNSSSISSSTSSMLINNNQNNINYNNNNNNNQNYNNNNNNNNNNNIYNNNNQELFDQILAERNGRINAEKKLEEKEVILHSLQNEMTQREEFEKKLLKLCEIEIKKKKKYQDSLNDLSEQISFILDTISNQTLTINNDIMQSDSQNHESINTNENNEFKGNITIEIDSNLVSQFENISNIIKSFQLNNSNDNDVHNNNSSNNNNNNNDNHNINPQNLNNFFPNSEESLYLELVKISKKNLPFQFSDVIS